AATPTPPATVTAPPIPIATPTSDAVEYNFPLPAATPTPRPVPVQQADRVSLSGSVTRPGEKGDMVPLAHHDVLLLATTAGSQLSTKTDDQGNFVFRNVEPRADYYLVVVSPLAIRQTYELNPLQVQGPNGIAIIPQYQQGEVRADLSWHQSLDLSTPGPWQVTLDRSNADPRFCAETAPGIHSDGHPFLSSSVGLPVSASGH
ncbi:MAG: carboxypeptidase-like regulatory domain-containing protein, partial [Candidatus Xenobia bacterium]